MTKLMTISALAEIMARRGDERSKDARQQHVWRALVGTRRCVECRFLSRSVGGICPQCGAETVKEGTGSFPSAYKIGPNTANWLIPEAEARAWLEDGDDGDS